jgi:hypothetical protein
MTNPPGDGTPPQGPEEPRPEEQAPSGQAPSERPPSEQAPGEQPPTSRPDEYQPGYWEQQAQEQAQQQGQQQPWQPSYPPAPGYYAQPSGYPSQQYAPDHPRATTSLVLGILGVVLCQILAPFAWAMGKRTLDEIDASQGTVGGRGAAQAGYILGIVGTVLLALGVIFFVIWLVFAVAIIGGGISTNS